MQQHAFDFQFDAHLRDDALIVSSCNEQAFSYMEGWPNWPSRIACFYGATGCGKTALATLWQQKTGACILSPKTLAQQCENSALFVRHKAFILEDVEHVTEQTALFHLLNRVNEQEGFLLLTSRVHPSALPWHLPDLRSRINAQPAILIDTPDDASIEMLLIKELSQHQLQVDYAVIAYLCKHVERSFTAVIALVEALEREALRHNANITIPFVRAYL